MWDAETRGSLFIIITNVRLFWKLVFTSEKLSFFSLLSIYLLLKLFIVFLYRKYYSRISKISWRSLFFSFAIFVGSIYSFGVILSLFLWLSISNELFIFVYAIVLFNCPFVWKKVRINNVAFQNCFSCYFVGVFLLSYFLMWKWWCCLSES